MKRKNGPSNKVVTDLEVFDIVVETHINLGHSGSRETFSELDRNTWDITAGGGMDFETLFDVCYKDFTDKHRTIEANYCD